MHLHRVLLGAAFAVVTGLSFAPVTVSAADGIYVPLLTYRTGAFAVSGTPISNGMSDYLNMLNERDGGIKASKSSLGMKPVTTPRRALSATSRSSRRTR